jgi:RNA polymerase sigma-70 factor (ECF subfamily)
MGDAPSRHHAGFPATQWSMILQAGGPSSPPTRAALEKLCEAYWPPLYAFLRRNGSDPHEAKDFVQGFLARLLERNDLESVTPERGRFRSYLLAGLRNYLISDARRMGALKRGGTAPFLSLETADAEGGYAGMALGELSPDEAFDRRWAETVLERAVEALRQEHAAKGKGEVFDVLRPALAGDAPSSHAQWARQLGMTQGAVTVAVHRLRGRLRELVRLDVAQTVDSPAAVEEEMRNLLAILSR